VVGREEEATEDGDTEQNKTNEAEINGKPTKEVRENEN
jgi:hypothetical protein